MKTQKFVQIKNDSSKPSKIGEIAEGKVVGIERSGFFVDLGAMGTGVILGKEFQEAKGILKNFKIGDNISAKIIELENEDGYIELSIVEAVKEINWKKIKEIKEKEELIKAKITGANKGGLLTEVYGFSAFLPVSQLSFEHYPRVEESDKAKIVKELQKFIGQEMELKIISLDLEEEKLVLSEKAKKMEDIKEIIKNYKAGDIVEGEITKITNFGAFIRFLVTKPKKEKSTDKPEKYLEGLIHISELDWKLIKDPLEVLKVGEKVKAKIIEIANERISLSLKALKKDPWQDIEKAYKKGDAIKGKVVKLNNFGALVRLEKPEIQGLCHISEFGSRTKMEEKIKLGENYNFKILSIDPKEHRMTLSFIK